MKLTKRFVERAPVPDRDNGHATQAFYRDDDLKGFALRVTSAGAKSYVLERRIKGRVRRMTLGKCKDLSLAKARRKAERLIGEIADDQDPIANRKRSELERVTLAQVLNDYLATRKDLKPRTVEDYRIVIQWGFGDWLTRPLLGISKVGVRKRHTLLGKRSPARANNAFRVLRALFNHAIAQYEDEDGEAVFVVNPVSVLGHTRAWYRIERRDRYLRDHELHRWFVASKTIENDATRDYLHLLLFTGLRKNEGLRLRWADVDLQDGTLRIPDTKNRVPHVLPLSDFLLQMMARRIEAKTGPWVFPASNPERHLVEPRRAIERITRTSGVVFSCHDLRRTFVTVAERLDLPAFALMRLINHKRFLSDVTAGYIGSDVDRLRGPMQAVADYLQRQCGIAEGAEVIELRSGRFSIGRSKKQIKEWS